MAKKKNVLIRLSVIHKGTAYTTIVSTNLEIILMNDKELLAEGTWNGVYTKFENERDLDWYLLDKIDEILKRVAQGEKVEKGSYIQQLYVYKKRLATAA